MKDRYLKYDVLRAAAIAMVLLGHISAYMVINFPDPTSADFFVSNIFNGFRRGASVPIFLMLTGALLLNEDKAFNTREFYNKSLKSIIILLIFWLAIYGVFYAFILPLLLGNAINLKDFIDYILIFRGSDYPHLWYLFMTVGLYISMPVLRIFARRENRVYVLGFIILSAILKFLPHTLNFLTLSYTPTLENFINKFGVEYLTRFSVYVLTGWYLANFKLDKSKRLGLYALGVILSVIATTCVRVFIADIPDIRDYLYATYSLNLLVSGAAFFVFISSICGDKLTKNNSVIKTLSNTSFGVYAVHVVILELLTRVIMPYNKFNLLNDSPFARPLLYIIILFALIYFISLALVLILSKFNLFKKFLRG